MFDADKIRPFLVLLNPRGGSRALGRLDREGRLCGRVRDCEVRPDFRAWEQVETS